MVLIGARFDILMQTQVVKESVIIAYLINEVISVIENIGLMGVPIPKAISDVVDVLRAKDY